MSHDLTRDDLRALVRLGLEQAGGSYRLLVSLFGLPETDYKRVLNFLRTHECQMATLRLRPATMGVEGLDRQPASAAPASAASAAWDRGSRVTPLRRT